MKTVAVIQARMSSTRLPGKTLADVAGQPLLGYLLTRLSRASRLDSIVVATSSDASDDPVSTFCEARGVKCFRGALHDVLDRFYQAARTCAPDAVVRVTGDCPLVDPEIVDTVIAALIQGQADYASNVCPPSFPDGFDVEVIRYATLQTVWREATSELDRAHVTTYVRESQDPQRFRRVNVSNVEDCTDLRVTVDQAEDLALIRQIAAHFGDAPYSCADVVAWLRAHPQMRALNAEFHRNEGYHGVLTSEARKGQLMHVNSGVELYTRAKRLIPGGTQLLSKRPEMFLPEGWPAYYSRAKGATVWDLDGRPLIDMAYNGIGACILGAADDEVDAAVTQAVRNGTMSTLNAPEEVALAELLCELHPWADMVRYARTGGEAMAIAVRIARATSGRETIAFCGYHGWHDWYLAANLSDDAALSGHLLPGLDPAGVPAKLTGSAFPFVYEDVDALEAILQRGDVGVIVMEPLRNRFPKAGFLQRVRELATRHNAVLVFDEITAGFRLNTGGAHLLFGVQPDVAVFGKGMSNGYPMAAVIGRASVMQSAQESFISSTYWTERIGPVAALATIKKHRRDNVAEHLQAIGARVKAGWQAAADAASLPLHVSGIDPLGHFAMEVDQAQAARTLYTQMMLDRGYLATAAFYATFAHDEAIVDTHLQHVAEVFGEIASKVAAGTVMDALRGPVAHTGFKRLT